jgi:N-acyl homoserine lactone hydrolase
MATSAQLTVKAIRSGNLTVDRSSLIYGRHFGEQTTVPIWVTAIVGGEKKILVDSGIHDRAWVDENIAPCRQAPEEQLGRALREVVGWQLDDVDIVVNTHLHYDHCGGNALFPNAEFYVQAPEWLFSAKPLATQGAFYQEFLIGRQSLDFFRWKFMTGIYDVIPGVRAFPTPGHTPGHQSVAVRTHDGTVVITGDCANCAENVFDEVPVGIVYDTGKEIESLRLIKKIADFILPGHDPLVEPGSAGIELPVKLKHMERENG